ncbi:PIF-6 [Urbanus proteus nucleopolyhedrovirus]|uniref:PIF-6 n=1 Tax=Urbanus proteus nucleopolyhedrovirus TaxID=1675866 RepID=A0A162GUN3_9ABAC|nr:PIF-6 [Urbanus proteus nucleopolyhedrovirus]AKR17357.1 PIF-6 [Urbanus proteus nucleopolyhedrovirus]
MAKVRWRILNTDRVEVVPSSRKRAWRKLIFAVLKRSPDDSNFRTLINNANFKHFDYNSPLIYEVKSKNLLVTNENLNRALNRATLTSSIMNIKSIQIYLAFISTILLVLITAFVFNTLDKIDTQWTLFTRMR